MTSYYVTPAIQTGTAMNLEENGVFLMAAASGSGIADLIYIKTRDTGSNSIEVHILSAESGFQKFSVQTGTTFAPEENGTWTMGDWNGDGKLDLIYIKTRNTGGNVELYVASGASGYQTRIFGSSTAFGVDNTDGLWTMADTNGDGKLDLVYIKTRNTGTKKVEVHIATGATDYQTIVLSTGTAFNQDIGADCTWLMQRFTDNFARDLVCIRNKDSVTGKVEVGMARGASQYARLGFYEATMFGEENNGTWGMASYTGQFPSDLYYIKTRNTGTGKVEVHIASFWQQ